MAQSNPRIFESPDGGETVYERAVGESRRTLIKENRSKLDQILEDKLWGEIRRKALVHPGLAAELERVKIFYSLLKETNG